MRNFNNLTGAELAVIIAERNHVVISIDQILAKTVGQAQNETHNYHIPNIPEEEVARFMATTTLFNVEDKQSIWNSFVLMAKHNGAVISFTNPNDVDCIVDIQFP